MDSCHIFNFLFGTKKATTELSKCFNSLSETARGARRSSRERERASPGAGRTCQSQPSSPLKQIQMKIASLASSSNQSYKSTAATISQHNNSNNLDVEPNGRRTETSIRGTSCDAKCGTYRATLVRLDPGLDDDDDSEGENLISARENYQVNDAKPFTNKQIGAQVREKLDIFDNNNSNSAIDNNADRLITVDEQETKHKPRQVVLYGNCDAQANGAESPINNECRGDYLITSAKIYSISPSSDDPPRVSKLHLTSSINPRLHDEEDNSYFNDSKSLSADNDVPKVNDKRQAYVKSLVKSIESNGSFDSIDSTESTATLTSTDTYTRTAIEQQQSPTLKHKPVNAAQAAGHYTKPVTLVKPMPPKTPPKSNKVKCLNLQLSLNKPYKIQQLFQDETFLARFFDKLEPIDRCVAAQVCRKWRNVLYADQHYWKDLINVIDCTQLRREHLIECILNTLQSSAAKLQFNNGSAAKARQQVTMQSAICGQATKYNNNNNIIINNTNNAQDPELHNNGVGSRLRSNSTDSSSAESTPSMMTNVLNQIDQDDIWRIQELCNKFTSQKQQARTQTTNERQVTGAPNERTATESNTNLSSNSKSSSIPSQISSTFSSVSLSSLFLSPLSESNKIETMKEKLYNSLDDRGFDALCLFGATDDDIEDLVAKIRPNLRQRIIVGRLNNCCLSDRGLELFIKTFGQIQELELSGCNEISNSIELRPLTNLKRLIITDSINIADGFAQKLSLLLPQLDELTLQAYHLTDAFLEYLSLNSDTSRLRRLELPNCKEITNQSLVTIAKHFPQLEALSISGSTKIGDDGIEILAELARHLRVLDLSWCTRITDASLECIACDLSENLTDLILDRNVNITDVGLGYLASMSNLSLLHIRWCPRISDIGLESVLSIKSLKYLSLAGLHQVTARSLLCLVEANLLELELTNCPAVNKDLLEFLELKMPNCNIIS